MPPSNLGYHRPAYTREPLALALDPLVFLTGYNAFNISKRGISIRILYQTSRRENFAPQAIFLHEPSLKCYFIKEISLSG